MPDPTPNPADAPRPGADPGPDPVQAPQRGPESVFLANLQAFGDRAARLCRLTRTGRISSDSCFVALTQLWIQLARSHRQLADRPEPHTSVPNSDPDAGNAK